VIIEYAIRNVQEKQKGLECNGACQLLICADNSLLYKTIYHGEEHRRCIVFCYGGRCRSDKIENRMYVKACCCLGCDAI
jgi:hypothetical protein